MCLKLPYLPYRWGVGVGDGDDPPPPLSASRPRDRAGQLAGQRHSEKNPR